ncbi:MAG: [NiFe]-hydrogenase assembly chaperone HybE [Betaproteobacteria bacterium]|nr:[NiFe]-hydrogenase assembly chaperone HybE [Betaproteobacteria bacterium]
MTAPADDLAAIGRTLEQAYSEIQHTRMRGLPIVNPALQVEVVGLRAWDGLCIGVLVTPWCMNLLALSLPGGRTLLPATAGTIRTLDLPAGRYDLLAAHMPQVGHYLSGSLYSPMDAFTSQHEAVAAARAALDLLFDAGAQAPAEAVPSGAVATDVASRRSFLFRRPAR